MTRKVYVGEKLDEDGELFMSILSGEDYVYWNRGEGMDFLITMMHRFQFKPSEVMYLDELYEKQEIEKGIAPNAEQKQSMNDRFTPTSFGVGYIGEGPHRAGRNGKMYKPYSVWRAMLARCYKPEEQKRNPSYKGCTVDLVWHNFQNFAEWYTRNYFIGCQLDKDIKMPGNRLYSPETCMLVTQKENIIAANAKHYSFKSPSGNIVEIYNLNQFCHDNDLRHTCMYRVYNGKRSHHKGWAKA